MIFPRKESLLCTTLSFSPRDLPLHYLILCVHVENTNYELTTKEKNYTISPKPIGDWLAPKHTKSIQQPGMKSVCLFCIRFVKSDELDLPEFRLTDDQYVGCSNLTEVFLIL